MVQVIAATAEVVYEAFLLYRKVVAMTAVAKSVITQADETFSAVSSVFSEDLKNHTSVAGEEVYLFLLGRELLSPIERTSPLSQDEISEIVLAALAITKQITSSNDVVTVVSVFLTEIGRCVALADQNVVKTLEGTVSSTSGTVTYGDPVINELITTKGVLPEATINLFVDYFGFRKNDVLATVSAFADPGVKVAWDRVLKYLSNSTPSFHRSALAYNLILRGAHASVPEPTIKIEVGAGADALTLFLPTLVPQFVETRTRQIPPDTRTINRFMVDQVQRTEMNRRGYIELGDKSWALPDQVHEVTVYDPNTQKQTVTLERKAKIKAADISSTVIEKVSEKIGGKIKSKAESAAIELVRKRLFSILR